jgi:hypothetical protein
MHKTILFMTIIFFIFASSVFGKNFQVKRVSEDFQKVVVVEDESKLELEVQKGDQINEWTIIDIQPDQVILRQEPEEDLFIENQMILRVPSQHIIMENKVIPQK